MTQYLSQVSVQVPYNTCCYQFYCWKIHQKMCKCRIFLMAVCKIYKYRNDSASLHRLIMFSSFLLISARRSCIYRHLAGYSLNHCHTRNWHFFIHQRIPTSFNPKVPFIYYVSTFRERGVQKHFFSSSTKEISLGKK